MTGMSVCRSNWLVEKGLVFVNCDTSVGYTFNFRDNRWDAWTVNAFSPWVLGQIGMGRPVTAHHGANFLQMPLWAGETQENARKSSNIYEYWDWYNGSVAESNNIQIDFNSGEVIDQSFKILDVRKIYNKQADDTKINVDFDTNLSVTCTIDQAANKLASGVKTYINLPIGDKDGNLQDKGKRIADSFNGLTAQKSWDISAWAKVSMPKGYGVGLNLQASTVTVRYSYNGAIIFQEDRTT